MEGLVELPGAHGHTLGVVAGDGGHTHVVLALASGGHTLGVMAGDGGHTHVVLALALPRSPPLEAVLAEAGAGD